MFVVAEGWLLEGGAREGAMHSRPQKPAPLTLPQLLVPFARSSSILVIWYASSASTLPFPSSSTSKKSWYAIWTSAVGAFAIILPLLVVVPLLCNN